MMAEKKDIPELTPKQKIFCSEYIYDWNATRAAIAAGYSEKAARQIASDNLSKQYLIDYISELSEEFRSRQKKKDEFIKDNSIGWVYIVKCAGTSYYKIGITIREVESRMRILQIGIPFDLQLITKVKCKNHKDAEIKMHKIFADHKVRSEWFTFSDIILEKAIRVLNKYSYSEQ